MVKAAVEQLFNGDHGVIDYDTGYDPELITHGVHTGQFDLGSGETDKFIGPRSLGVANFGESPLAVPSAFVHPIQIAPDLFWVFGSDAATAAVTRRVQLWTWQPSTNVYALQGAITATFPTTGNVTCRGLRAILTNYTTGTVAVSGTAVTGTGTAWLTQCVGSRIGFGSTDPNEITEWYNISARASDTGITLETSAGTITAGTTYVIQDLMIVHANTNATLTNGGLFVIKGLNFSDFQSPAKVIPAATTVDKIKAVYWLKDAATVTNTAIGGCALSDFVSWTEQFVISPNGAATALALYKYNIRAAITPVSGAAVLSGANLVVTGNQTVTGNILQTNNGRFATLNHGPGLGVESLYMLTTTRIIRIPGSAITAGSTTFVADSMSEVPPGGVATNLSGATFSTLDISDGLDKLVFATATGQSIYVSDYYADGSQIDRRATCVGTQTVGASRDLDSPIFVHNVTTSIPFIWIESGWLFFVFAQAATANLNAMTVYPLAADKDFEEEAPNRIICPKIDLGATPANFYRVLVNEATNIGSFNMGVSPDMYELHYRTGGIDDNSGAWTVVPQTGDLSGVSVSDSIQFSFVFRTLGVILLPARILSLALIYETDDGLPSQYRWNFADFNNTTATFAWVQSALFGGSLTVHTIEIYRADTNALVLTQDSSDTTNGTFEYWNGSAWVAGLGTDTLGTRRRFVPTASLPGSVNLYARIIVA